MSGQSFKHQFWRWMYEGVRVGEVRGIQVKVHFALVLLVAIWMLGSLVGPEPLWSAFQVLIFAGVLFGSVLAHELGHCWGASRVGGHSHEIVLWPLGGLAMTSGADRSAFHEFVVTLAGPLVSLVLAAVFGAIVLLTPDALTSTTAGSVLAFTLVQARNVNLMLFLFNMLVPLFPMDAARIVRSVLSMKYSPEKVTYNLCLAGFFVAGMMVCLYFVAAFGPETFFARSASFMLIFIAIFGVQSCVFEMRSIEHHYVYGDPFPQGPPYRELPGQTLRAFGMNVTRARIIEIPSRETSSGSHPEAPRKPAKPNRPLTERERLEQELDEAVSREEFGRAAELRDKLRSLPAGSSRS
jgi:Zn-dependent protease